MADNTKAGTSGGSLPTGITLRSDGRYMWRFKYAGVSYTGYARKLTDAKKALRDKKYEVEHGIYSKEQNISVDAWFTEWFDVYKSADCKASTLDLYKRTYERYIKKRFGNMRLKTLRADMLQRFINSNAETYSESVASLISLLLDGALRQAARNGIIAKNPMDNTTPPKYKERKVKKALSADEERILLETAKKESPRFYNLFRMASLTGMRLGEILGLQWSDIDFDKGEIKITHTLAYIYGRGSYLDTPKSASSRRIIPMEKNHEVYTLLKEWRTEQKRQRLHAGQYWHPLDGMEDIVFTTSVGTPYMEGNVQKEMRRLVALLSDQSMDIKGCTFHTLRHCFATRCIENGMDPKALQAILGHSTFAMTMDLYCDVMESTKRREMEKISLAL